MKINKSIDYIIILINNTWYILDTLFFNTTDIEDEGLFKNGFYNVLLYGDNQFNNVKCYGDVIWTDDIKHKEIIESINKYLG